MNAVEIPTKDVRDLAKALGYRRKKVRVYASESNALSVIEYWGPPESVRLALVGKPMTQVQSPLCPPKYKEIEWCSLASEGFSHAGDVAPVRESTLLYAASLAARAAFHALVALASPGVSEKHRAKEERCAKKAASLVDEHFRLFES